MFNEEGRYNSLKSIIHPDTLCIDLKIITPLEQGSKN